MFRNTKTRPTTPVEKQASAEAMPNPYRPAVEAAIAGLRHAEQELGESQGRLTELQTAYQRAHDGLEREQQRLRTSIDPEELAAAKAIPEHEGQIRALAGAMVRMEAETQRKVTALHEAQAAIGYLRRRRQDVRRLMAQQPGTIQNAWYHWEQAQATADTKKLTLESLNVAR